MADWEEIKRLAADFQKIQSTSTIQKLSERNCIEIVSWLINRKMIDLIFTIDGKEYLTPNHLIIEIKNELIVNNGRINLVELSKTLGVDLAHIQTYLSDVLKSQKDIQLVLGQLIDSTYINRIASEINEKLYQQGHINISDLTIQYDLPAEFLQQNVLEKHLGKLIQGKQDKNDPRFFFTENFIKRCIHKIQGALNSVTRPTPVSLITSQIEINEKLFFTLIDEATIFGNLTSRMTGAQFIPDIYSRSQNKWVNNFYKQNYYLEYDTLNKLGIFDYKNYIKKHFPNETLYFLNSCVISNNIRECIEADLDECIQSKSHINLQNNLPSVFNEKDIEMVLELVLTKSKAQQILHIDNYIISKIFLEDLSKHCNELMKIKAKEIVESGKYQQYQMMQQQQSNRFNEDTEVKIDKRDERRKKAASGKSGGGTQGRETKTKSTKKHQRKIIQDENRELSIEKTNLEIISINDIIRTIEIQIEEEGLNEIVESLAQYLYNILNEEGLKLVKEIHQFNITGNTANRRQTHNELQNKLNTLISDVRLFDKGLKLLQPNLQQQLIKYLLKTLCTDIVNEILNYIATEENLNTRVNNLNNEQKVKFINDLGLNYKNLLPLIKCLQGQSIDDFMNTIEEGLTQCSMILKKIDKKKDRIIILNNKHELLEQLNKCDDLAMILHLTILIIFITSTNCMIHISGRHIGGVLEYLKQFLHEDVYNELLSYFDFVTLMLSSGTETENAREKLKEKMQFVKNIARDFKKMPLTDKI